MRSLTLFSLFLTMACTPSRDKAVSGATRSYCERSLECDWIGEEDMEECYDDMEDVFSDLWPESECESDISAEGYDECLASIEAIGCDDWLDYLSAVEDCGSSDVCE